VMIDGEDVRHYKVRSLREKIAIVLQEPVLFAGTIRDNLRYGRLDATDEEVEAAAQAAHAHEFIRPAAEAVRHRDRRGGRRPVRRRAPAVEHRARHHQERADPDPRRAHLVARRHLEEIVFAAIRRLRAGRTTLVIAHRLSTVRDADCILVLDGGRIAAKGRHDELLEQSELYRRIVRPALDRQIAGRPRDGGRAHRGGESDEVPGKQGQDRQGGRTGERGFFPAHPAHPAYFSPEDPVRRIIARYPFGGVTWCSLMYSPRAAGAGTRGVYIEDTGECVYDPVQNTRATDPTYGTTYIHNAARTPRPGRPMVVRQLRRQLSRPQPRGRQAYAADADLFINLSGGSWFWRDEYARIPRKAFVDSDPAFTQLAIAKAEPWYVEFFQRFDRLFTFGANIGTPASAIPTGPFTWHKTWQPITLDDWQPAQVPRDRFTTVMTWQIESFRRCRRQQRRGVREVHRPAVRERRSASSWRSTVTAAAAAARRDTWMPLAVSRTPAAYRGFIHGSKAEFGVAKHTYVAADRAGSAIARSAILPPDGPRSCRTPGGPRTCRRATGCSRSRRPKEALAGIDTINTAYNHHARCALDIAREHFDASRVLPKLLETALG